MWLGEICRDAIESTALFAAWHGNSRAELTQKLTRCPIPGLRRASDGAGIRSFLLHFVLARVLLAQRQNERTMEQAPMQTMERMICEQP